MKTNTIAKTKFCCEDCEKCWIAKCIEKNIGTLTELHRWNPDILREYKLPRKRKKAAKRNWEHCHEVRD